MDRIDKRQLLISSLLAVTVTCLLFCGVLPFVQAGSGTKNDTAANAVPSVIAVGASVSCYYTDDAFVEEEFEHSGFTIIMPGNLPPYNQGYGTYFDDVNYDECWRDQWGSCYNIFFQYVYCGCRARITLP